MIEQKLIEILACPACEDRPPVRLSDDGRFLVCDECERNYPVRDGIPIMLVEEAERSPSTRE